MEFLGLIIFIILCSLLVKIINKLLGIDKEVKISETSGKNVDRWGRGIILVIFLCSLPFFIEQEVNVMKSYLMLFSILVFGFESILEWKYLKSSKQYISTLISLMLVLIFIYNIELFLKLMDWISLLNN